MNINALFFFPPSPPPYVMTLVRALVVLLKFLDRSSYYSCTSLGLVHIDNVLMMK
jgi:hypothetical protein